MELFLDRQGTQSPIGPMVVDWGNPITQGLVSLVPGAGMRDVVSGAPSAINTTTGPRANVSGVSAVYAGSQYAQATIKTGAFAGAKTLLVFGLVDAGGANRILVGVANSGSATSVAEIYWIGSGSNQISYVEVGAGASSGNTTATETAVSVGQPFVAVARTIASNNRTLAVRTSGGGVGTATNTTSATQATNVNALMLGVERYNGALAAYHNGDIYLAACWSRALSDSEVTSLAGNPWQLFAPRRIWVPQAAGAPATFNPAWARNRNTIITGPLR